MLRSCQLNEALKGIVPNIAESITRNASNNYQWRWRQVPMSLVDQSHAEAYEVLKHL